MTSLNEDQPGEIIASSKSSMNASVLALVRTRVPAPSHRLGAPPLELPLEPELPPELEPELELEPEPELEPELPPDPEPEELLAPDELELEPGGAEPLEHPAVATTSPMNNDDVSASATTHVDLCMPIMLFAGNMKSKKIVVKTRSLPA